MKSHSQERRQQFSRSDAISFPLAGELEVPQAWRGEYHSHPFFEQLQVVDGEMEIREEKLATTMRPGQSVLIFPDIEHRVFCSRKYAAKIFYIGFKLSAPLVVSASDGILIQDMSETESLLSQSRQERLMERFRKGEPLLYDQIKCVEPSLRQLEELCPDAFSTQSSIVSEACRYIEENVDQKLSVANLAAKYYLSPQYFGELFLKETGVTIKKYHNSLRMRTALELLLQKKMNINQIALNLGFSSAEYFSRQFRKHFGFPPSRWDTSR